jgi:hypothetical protein
MHSAPLRPEEVAVVTGLPVTSLARTVLDLARTMPFEEAVAVADAALHRAADRGRRVAGAGGDGVGTIDQAALADALLAAARWPGTPAARRVVAFADGRSASVGESRSRIALRRAGLPAPVLQWPVVGRDGRFIGYTDFGWPEQRVVGEFDGRIKYGELLRPGEAPSDVVVAEKLREDRLREEDLSVVRWTWTDLANFTPVATRIRRRLDRSFTAPRRPS